MAYRGNQFEGSDDYYTPKYIFDALECEFDTDVACPKDLTHIQVPAKHFIHENSLELDWNGFVWMNPPFSGRNGKINWVNKFYQQGDGIALFPDRTSAPWWPIAAKQADLLMFITGKVKFITPSGLTANSPGTGTTLFGCGEKAIKALRAGERNNLGIILKSI